MTQSLAVLYSAAVAVVAAWGFLARSNRRSGWVKRRNSVFADLLALKAHWDEMDGKAGTPVVAETAAAVAKPMPGPNRAAEANFSTQLAKMQQALATAPAEAPEAVERVTA